ncbi:universal stress protein [Sphingobacterium sp. DN00404]|uniref:Universal stress protein n=1 Tax=Sphingobacterium micropteri TaxID=2763501 RepID=A0ABR7YL28_9SPHI|nr:universal stress protein [Sphingobacterium micropteri]MBD1432030.1 universal stress protein [Sphingobacterium micropteri]
MKNAILVPTDFSDNARTAVIYAAHYAAKHNWQIHLLHTYHEFSNARAGIKFTEEVRTSMSETATQNMKKLEADLRVQFPDIVFTSACMLGDLSKTVLDLLQTDQYNFLIMGTKGASHIKSATIGSNTFELIKKSPIGVLAVPENYQHFKLAKIGLLTNFKESEAQLLRSFTARIQATLDLVLLHVTEKEESPALTDVEFWKEQIVQRFPIKNIDYCEKNAVYRLDYNMPIPKCIDWMIEKTQVDLLLVAYNRKSFFAQLFSRSLTKSIAHNLLIPTFFIRNDIKE